MIDYYDDEEVKFLTAFKILEVKVVHKPFDALSFWLAGLEYHSDISTIS